MTLIGRNVTVLGAGVAGLTVARALALRGASVTVLEQAAEIREFGAGLQITPNGAAVLRALGLGPEMERIGLRSHAIELYDGLGGGQVLRLNLRTLRPDQPHRKTFGHYFFHRADLIALLADAARDAGVQIRLLQRIDSVTLDQGRAQLHTAQGATVECDLLIGADGLHSKARMVLNAPAQPTFTGQVAWRAVIPAKPEGVPVARVYMGPKRHLVSYPLRGGTLRNIVAVEERANWTDEGWNHADDPASLRAAFAGFAPEVRDWLNQVEQVNLWGLFRHPVAPHWQNGALAILGDAAHPTLPFLAQGANMALEDAWVLAEFLDRHDTVEAALAAYEAVRIPRTTRIVAAATANARRYHLSGPVRGLAHLGLRVGGWLAPRVALKQFDWLYSHDVTRQG